MLKNDYYATIKLISAGHCTKECGRTHNILQSYDPPAQYCTIEGRMTSIFLRHTAEAFSPARQGTIHYAKGINGPQAAKNSSPI